MAAGLIVLAGRMPARDANGRSTIGRLRVYENKTNDEVSVYSSAALTTALSQPISSDSAGQFPLIWIDGANTPVTVAYEDDSGQTQTYDDVTASTAAAAALVNAYAGAVSLSFTSATTDADHGVGTVAFNSATLAHVEWLYIDNASIGGTSITGFVHSFDDANTTTNRGTVALRAVDDLTTFMLFKVTGPVADGTGYMKVPVEYYSGALPSHGEQLVMGFAVAGPAGQAATVTAGTATTLATTASPTVENGGTSLDAVLNFGIPRGAPGGVLYKFADPTTDSNPGAGNVRFNNATPASVDRIYVNNADANGNPMAGWLDAIDDSTNPIKGSLIFRQLSNGRLITYNVTNSVVDGTGYRKLTVIHTAGSTLFDNGAELSVNFERAGNAGADGEGAGDVVGPASATDGALAVFDGTTGKLLKVGPAAFPAGGIIMWSGTVASIPAGWALCNGANGTPDLRSKFVVGAGSTYSPGATGGQASVTPTITVDNHTLTTAQMPSHAHNVAQASNVGAGSAGYTDAGGQAYPTGYAGGGQAHNHTASSSAVSTLPPYYALAFIMKL